MKKNVTLLLLFFALAKFCSSASILILADGFTFTPATVTANVGDTIMFGWISGTHTTTSTNIPVGATPWNEPLTQANPFVMYQVSVAGEYDYQCNIHVGMGMVGHITVTNSSNINQQNALQVRVLSTLIKDDLKIEFSKSSLWKVDLFNASGELAKSFERTAKAGTTEVFSMSELPAGIYIVRVTDGLIQKNLRIIKE